jgi:hypothetical protein
MSPKRKRSYAVTASMPKKSRDVIPMEMIIIVKEGYAEIARLYGKKIKEKIRASFYVVPNTANVTAKAREKSLMNLEKDLQFWVKNMHTNKVRFDDIMLRQITLSI